MQFKPDEISAIVKDFDEPGSLAPTGLHLGGAKYMVIQGEPGAVIRGKKVDTDISRVDFGFAGLLIDRTSFTLCICCQAIQNTWKHKLVPKIKINRLSSSTSCSHACRQLMG